MGSWNKTCGISNLYIRAGEETYVFLITENKDGYSHCYSSHLYRPLLLPFVAEYDDYGTGENCRGVTLPYIIDGLKNVIKEMPLGENKYHDIEVKKDKLDVELMFNAIRESRLRKKDDTKFEFVMMRKDVIDEIMREMTFSSWAMDGTVKYKLQDVYNDIDILVEYLSNLSSTDTLYLEVMIPKLKSNFIEGMENLAGTILKRQLSYKSNMELFLRIEDLLIGETPNNAKHILESFFLGIFVNEFMESTRKSWIPMGQEGSQQQDNIPYIILNQAMQNAMNKNIYEEE